MAARGFLGGFELLVLLALIRLDQEAYGVLDCGRDRREQRPRVARRRLHHARAASTQGSVVRLGEPATERGGRAKTYFRTAKGLREVRQARQTLITLWQGVPRLTGGVA
jgi:hypothetical protein